MGAHATYRKSHAMPHANVRVTQTAQCDVHGNIGRAWIQIQTPFIARVTHVMVRICVCALATLRQAPMLRHMVMRIEIDETGMFLRLPGDASEHCLFMVHMHVARRLANCSLAIDEVCVPPSVLPSTSAASVHAVLEARVRPAKEALCRRATAHKFSIV